MKKIILAIALILSLVACSVVENTSGVNSSTSIPNFTLTAILPSNTPRILPAPPSLMITATEIKQPTRTPHNAPTQTFIPSVTPTYDVSKITTVTPAPPESCPKIDDTLRFEVTLEENPLDYLIEEPILEFLNLGGKMLEIERTLSELELLSLDGYGLSVTQADLTGDGVQEIVIFENGTEHYDLTILGCFNGDYVNLFDKRDIEAEAEIKIDDINKNGISEFVLASFGCFTRNCLEARVIEWDGEAFQDLIRNTNFSGEVLNFVTMIGGKIDDWKPELLVDDIDNNGIPELLLVGDVPLGVDYIENGPWRNRTDVFMWNGENFIPFVHFYSRPEYRFQAVQDGDLASSFGNYDLALSFYEGAIVNDELKWWSPEKAVNLSEQLQALNFQEITPTIVPEINSDYSQLVGYAYYRIMLLRILFGQKDEAKTTYETLREMYSDDAKASAYVELAESFWNIYQQTQDLEQACNSAIQFATIYPEILTPLGNVHSETGEFLYHGSQSLYYSPDDICPYK